MFLKKLMYVMIFVAPEESTSNLINYLQVALWVMYPPHLKKKKSINKRAGSADVDFDRLFLHCA